MTNQYEKLDEIFGVKHKFCPNSSIYNQHDSWWDLAPGKVITIVNSDDSETIRFYIDLYETEYLYECRSWDEVFFLAKLCMKGL